MTIFCVKNESFKTSNINTHYYYNMTERYTKYEMAHVTAMVINKITIYYVKYTHIAYRIRMMMITTMTMMTNRFFVGNYDYYYLLEIYDRNALYTPI